MYVSVTEQLHVVHCDFLTVSVRSTFSPETISILRAEVRYSNNFQYLIYCIYDLFLHILFYSIIFRAVYWQRMRWSGFLDDICLGHRTIFGYRNKYCISM